MLERNSTYYLILFKNIFIIIYFSFLTFNIFLYGNIKHLISILYFVFIIRRVQILPCKF
jgi:hypothetical protein